MESNQEQITRHIEDLVTEVQTWPRDKVVGAGMP